MAKLIKNLRTQEYFVNFVEMKSDWTIKRYNSEESAVWDRFAAESRQGTLLHMRGYMDYHSDRFADCSLMAFRKETLMALLPANIDSGGILHSHQGLTYGGWLTPFAHFDGSDMLDLFDAFHDWCRENAVGGVVYKPVPHIYHRLPAEEDIYALFRNGYEFKTVNLSSVIDMRCIPSFNTQQKRHFKKSLSMNPWVRETDDVEAFMDVLEECLRVRHDAAPVHSAEELRMLKQRFPEAIRLFVSGTGSDIEAEGCIYDCAGVAHCQYIATTEAGRANGSLTFLMQRLIADTFADHRYFDFGTSNEDAGRILNSGLIHQKFGLGGRGVVYPHFFLTF